MDLKTKKKNKVLGELYSTARARLAKLVLFKLIVKYKENICYRCKKEIFNIGDLSIEHKVAWLNSDKPKQLFYDLDNVTFSHLKCNNGARMSPSSDTNVSV